MKKTALEKLVMSSMVTAVWQAHEASGRQSEGSHYLWQASCSRAASPRGMQGGMRRWRQWERLPNAVGETHAALESLKRVILKDAWQGRPSIAGRLCI